MILEVYFLLFAYFLSLIFTCNHLNFIDLHN